jgi:hypothetical protein
MKDWKKSLLLILTAIMVILLFAFGGGPDRYKNATIIGVLPQHATRVEIVYKNEHGDFLYRSTHQSEIVTDGKTIVNPQDFLSGYCETKCKQYYINNK